jgi:hypothetical protein
MWQRGDMAKLKIDSSSFFCYNETWLRLMMKIASNTVSLANVRACGSRRGAAAFDVAMVFKNLK